MKPLFDAVVLATIASYAQGMDILREASAVYKYGLNMPSIAQIWKGGCIIRSKLLSKIQDAYNKDPNLKNLIFDDWFNNEIATRLDNLAEVVSLSTKAGIPAFVDKETTLAKLSNLVAISLLNQSSKIKFFRLGSVL